MENQQTSEEKVLREYPNTTYLLEGRQVRAAGNLVLTNQRLVFLKQVMLSEQQAEELRRLSTEATTGELIQFAVKLHKKNFQIPLSSIVTAEMGMLSYFPIRPYLSVHYLSAGKKEKTLEFMFTLPWFKRLMLSEFPTLGWRNAIRGAVKKERKSRLRG